MGHCMGREATSPAGDYWIGPTYQAPESYPLVAARFWPRSAYPQHAAASRSPQVVGLERLDQHAEVAVEHAG